MSDFLAKNLSIIAQYNKGLYKKLAQTVLLKKNFELCANPNGEFNLKIDSVPVHSVTGAVLESKNICQNLPHHSPASVHLIFGLGLGYLVDEIFEGSKGKMVVFEPDLETLFVVLSAVDFSKYMQSQRLYIVSDFAEMENVLDLVFKYKSKVSISALNYYLAAYKSLFNSFKDVLQRYVDINTHNYMLQAKTMLTFFNSSMRELDKKYQLPLLSDYKDVYKDKPAIIVSAGPSLSKNIEALKKIQDKALIFCVGTAVPVLYKNGIKPDFINVIERRNTFQHYNFQFSDDVNLIVEPYTEPSYFNLNFKNIFVTASVESDAARWFLEKADKELQYFEAKGTVAYHALSSAYYLGCNPIILIGQDLAYSDGHCYSSGSKFDGLVCEFNNDKQKYEIYPKDFKDYVEIYCASLKTWTYEQKAKLVEKHLESVNKNIFTVPGQNGEKLPTSSVYYLFLQYMQEFAQKHANERTLINTSIGGADIKGFELLPLEQAAEKLGLCTLDKKAIIGENKLPSSFDISKCISSVSDDINILKHVQQELEKGSVIAQNLAKELSRTKGYYEKAMTLMQRCTNIYADLVNNVMLKHRIYKIISVEEYFELSYLMREYSENTDYKAALEFSAAYNAYFKNVYEKTVKTTALLVRYLEKMKNESSVAKS